MRPFPFGAGPTANAPGPATRRLPASVRMLREMDGLLWNLLGCVVLPLWLACGVADYLCHARTDLAHTSGARESAMHLLQTGEIGIPMLGYLLLAHTPLLMALLVAGVVLHTLTAYVDVRYAAPRRHIPVFEQFVHGFLTVLPMVALALVAVLEWPQFRALFRPATTGAEAWTLRFEPAFEPVAIATVLAASVVLGVLPGLLEFAHAWRARR